MTQPTTPEPKKIVLTYVDNGPDNLDIRVDSEGFGGDMEMLTIYLHKTIQAILNSEEENSQ